MSTLAQPAPIYELQVTGCGPLIDEFTEVGVWVFFQSNAPEELLEVALLHNAKPPTEPIAAGQQLAIDGQRFRITGVGNLANRNIRELGHMVLKANGAAQPELPGEVCIAPEQLPTPYVGMVVQIWKEEN